MARPLISYEEARAPRKPRPKKGVKKVNAKRGGQRFPERRQPEFMRWFDDQKFPCVAADERGFAPLAAGPCGGVIEKAHVKSRGAGGEDIGNVVSCCSAHHRRLHSIGQRQFEFEIGKKLGPIARRITAAWYAFKKHG